MLTGASFTATTLMVEVAVLLSVTPSFTLMVMLRATVEGLSDELAKRMAPSAVR